MKNSKSFSSRYKVPNLERGLLIMELLVDHPDGLVQSEISTKLRCSNTSVYRITMTLLERGYLVRDPDTKAFKLSRKLLAIGCKSLTEGNLLNSSLDVMRKLRDTVKETVLLGTLIGREGVVLEQVLGTHPFKFSLDIGARLPLHCAAPCKSMLAYLPKEECDDIVDKIEFTRYNQNTITDPDKFRKELAEIRKNNYALDQGEQLTGIHCVAAPILGHHDYPIASIWITGPTDRILKSDFQDLGRTIWEHALIISRRLGYEVI